LIDYDNTLHDTEAQFQARLDGVYGLTMQQYAEAYVQVHREIVHVRYPDMHDDFFFHQRLICEHLGRSYDEEEARQVAKMIELANNERWTAPWFFPDTLAFLDGVRESYTLCLTTGDFAREKADALEKMGGKTYFSFAFDHTHLGIKGSGDFFRKALETVKAQADDAIVIGDCPDQDVRAAREAGIAAIWVNRKRIPLPDPSAPPDYEAADLHEALKHLDNL